jgi:putative oxidoreductase
MPELSGLFSAETPKTGWGERLAKLVPPILVGLLFVLIGYTKFNGNPRGEWYQTFERIGLGQWFRVFTGLVQVSGGILMCIPRTLFVGAVLLASTMIGAVLVDLFVIRMPFFIIPFFLAVVIVIVAMLCADERTWRPPFLRDRV